MASPTLLLTSSEGGLAQDVVFLALALTITKGDGECHGCVKSDALGNRSASFAFGRPCSSKVSRQNSNRLRVVWTILRQRSRRNWAGWRRCTGLRKTLRQP